MGKDSKNHKKWAPAPQGRSEIVQNQMCPLQKHLCRAPRLIKACLREAAGDFSSSKDNLMQSFICVSAFNLTLQPGEWSPKCVWHVSISISQSQAFPTSCSLLRLIHSIFSQGKLEPPAQDNPGGVLTKGTQLRFNLWDCSLWSLAGPGWCLDCKRPELLTLI